MKLVTRDEVASRVLTRFAWQYTDKPGGYCLADGRLVTDILDQLTALGPHPTARQVDAVMGNDSWTEPPPCTLCKARNQPVVKLEDELFVCQRCVDEAKALFAAKPEEPHV